DCDIVFGGPPCQGFSVAGKMDPDDPRSRLVWEFVRVVRDKSPRVFVMENVKALAVLAKWREVRDALLSEFARLGYAVEARVLDASDHGVPQQRERVFFIGIKEGDPSSLFPEAQEEKRSVREAFRILPACGEPGNAGICRAKIAPAVNPVLRKSPFAGMLFNGLGRPIDLDRPSLTLPASMGGNKTPIIDQLSLETGEEQWVVGYHAGLWAGGKPCAEVPARLRRLTVEECAALQTFPTDYRFCGKQSSRYCQIGNAVPPLLAQAVAGRIMAEAFSPSKPKPRAVRPSVQLTLFGPSAVA
ncbi:MAG: DNA cytosine methyltransferase, partial [Gemmataceae bacterium]|nr:DNA cytosine methyltransferase [Gemmataceae bacterium]